MMARLRELRAQALPWALNPPGLRCLAEAPALRVLDLRYNDNLTWEGVRELQGVKRGLEVLDVRGCSKLEGRAGGVADLGVNALVFIW